MLTAKKDNKVYSITEQEKQRYLNEGFDVYESGELIQYSPKKKIEYNKYVELEKKLVLAQEEIMEAKKTMKEFQETHDDLVKERNALKAELAKANKGTKPTNTPPQA